MNRSLIGGSLLFLSLATSAAGAAQPTTPQHQVASLESFGHMLRVTMTAQFVERQDDNVSRGQLSLGSNGKLRWERTAPYQELIINNGRTAWHVEPDLNHAIRLDQRMVRGWAEVFEPGVALQHYTSTQTGQEVALRRRADASNEWPDLDITFNRAGRPVTIVFLGDKSMRVELSGWTRTPKIDFNYTPKPGMDIIGQATGDQA